MRIFRSLISARRHISKLKQNKKTIGFVPTMGALHEGHLSLIKKSRRENNITAVSIFINPLQFGPKEDFKKYPRKEKKDKLLLKKELVDIIIYPTVEEMYPDGFSTYVDIRSLDRYLCGKARPGHFKGVATVVCKLLNIAEPNIMYLGQKDAQQAAIIRQMMKDLNFSTSLKVCQTIREASGLALSSRNEYLSREHKIQAPELYKALRKAKSEIQSGEKSASKVQNLIRTAIKKNTSGRIEYVECVDAKTLQPLKNLNGQILIAAAVHFGQARLIDNIMIRIS